MVMESQQREDYYSRAKELRTLFWLNLDIVKTELVPKGSPVDYMTHQLVCGIYDGIISARSFISQFELMAMQKDRPPDDHKKEDELFKGFNKLEETFDVQTQLLETLRIKP